MTLIESKIRARATAKEYPSNSYPFQIDGKFIRDERGHMLVTDGTNILTPIKEIHNTDMFVTTGKYWIADIMIGEVSGSLTHIGVGNNSSGPTVTDTDLISNIGTRHLYTDRFRGGNVDTISTFFSSSENNGTWNETGIFTGASGILFCRSTFAGPVTKASSNTQTIDFDITVT